MRRLLVALGVLAALLVVAAVVVVMNLNRLVEANRDRIVAGVSAGFGRPVAIGRIAVALRGGLGVDLDDVRVADDPAFSTEPFLVAARAHVRVAWWPLLSRRVDVRRIVVTEPAITLIRTARGMNVDSLGRPPAAPGPARPPGAPAAPTAFPAVAVALLNLEHGTIRVVDRTGPKPVERLIAPLDVRVSDVSLTQPMRLDVSATLAGDGATTVHVRGAVGPIGDPPFAADVPIAHTVSVRGPAVNVERLDVTGTVRREADGRPRATVAVRAPSASLGRIALTGLDVAATDAAGVATLERLAFGVFGGTVEGKGRVDHAGAAPAFAFDTTVRGIDVEEALAAGGGERSVRLVGRLDADSSITGNGADPAAVRRTLAGRGHAAMRDGAIHGLNIAGGVLGENAGLAGLVALVPPRLRDRYPEIFATADTRFDALTADVRIGGERLQIDSAVAAAKDYEIRAHGIVTFARYVDVAGTLRASQALTADVLGGVKEARLLTDAAGVLAIPFRLTGQLPNVRPRPDGELVERVLKKALVDQGIGRFLGGGKPSGKGSNDDSLLRRGLEQLLGR